MKVITFAQIICFAILISYSNGLLFSIQRAVDFLFYQKVSYCPAEQISHWSCGTICEFHKEMQDVRILSNSTNKAQGYMGYHDKKIIIAFRGSRFNVANWVNNFDLAKVKYPRCANCQIHRGFFRTYNDLSQQMFKNLKEMIAKYPNASIAITGHSLGGSVATIAAVEILDYIKGTKTFISEFQTFGQPRVGNAEFVAYFNKNLPFALRIVNKKDLVVRMPMRLFGFYHVGTEVWFSSGKDFKICTELSEDPSCSVSFTIGNVLDHIRYLNNDTGCNKDLMLQKPECFVKGVNICDQEDMKEEEHQEEEEQEEEYYDAEDDDLFPRRLLREEFIIQDEEVSKDKNINA